MKNYNVEKFIGSLVQAGWSTVFTAVTVNEAWENFKIIVLKVIDNIAPVKQIRLKQRTEPWLTAEILELIKIRDMFLYKFRKEKNSDFYKQFCFYRNKVQKEVKTAKSDFLSNKIEENKNNPKKLWEQIKSLGYINKSKSSPNIVLNIDNENCYEDKKIANHFNIFFTTVASVLVQKLPPCSQLFSTSSEKFKNFYKVRNSKGKVFRLHTVSEEFVYKELKFSKLIQKYRIGQYLSKVSKGWSFIFEIANHIYN